MEWDNVFIILIIAKDVPTLNPSKHSPCPTAEDDKEEDEESNGFEFKFKVP